MRQIDARAGYASVRSHLRVLAKRLKSRPSTAPLAAPIDDARRALDERIEAWEAADDDSVVATGNLHYADEVEDRVVADLARRAKVIVAGKLTSPAYLRLFPKAASELTAGVADDAQVQQVEHLIETIANNDDYRALRGVARQLDEAHQEVLLAREERMRSEQQAAAAWTELQIAEEAARAAYRDTHPKLTLLFPGRRRLVNSFFPQKRSAQKKAALPATGTAPESPTRL